jgi:hypothetical protein
MAAEWFCIISGEAVGPLSSQQLRAMVRQGKLKAEHPIRQGTAGPWVPAGRVKGLFPSDHASPVIADSTDFPAAKPGSGAAGTPAPRARPAAPRAVRPLHLPVAQPAPEPPPPAAPPAPRRPPSGPAAKPAAAAGSGLGRFAIDADADTPAARITGRRSGVGLGRRKSGRKNAAVVASLALLVVALGIVAAVLAFSSGGFGGRAGPSAANAPNGGDENAPTGDHAAGNPGQSGHDASASRSDGPATDPAANHWVDATDSAIRRASVKVRILSAETGYPAFARALESPEPLRRWLLIAVELQNLDPGKGLKYSRFGGRASPGVRLTDNLGNTYRRKTFGRPAGRGQLGSVVVRAGEPVEDLLVFDPPAESVDYLRLELPAAAFGGQGTLNFQIPNDMIAAADKKPEPLQPAEDDRRSGLDRPGRPLTTGVSEIERGIEQLEAEAGPAGDVPGRDGAIRSVDSAPHAGPRRDAEDGPVDVVSKINRDIEELGGGDQEAVDEESSFEEVPKEGPEAGSDRPRDRRPPRKRPRSDR